MLRGLQRHSGLPALLAFCLAFSCPNVWAQATENYAGLLDALPSLMKMEISERLNLWDPQGRLAMERWKLRTSYKAFSLQYANEVPVLPRTLQFFAPLPGYRMLEFSLKGKWGSLQGFRSTGYNSRFGPKNMARNFSGAAFQFLKAPMGTRIGAFFVRGSQSNSRENGKQLGITLDRDFKKSFRFESEWTRSTRAAPVAGLYAQPKAGHGLFMKFSGTVARSEVVLSYLSQASGLGNPLLPAQGRARNLRLLELRRAYKKMQFQYVDSLESQQVGRQPELSSLDTRRQNAQWLYAAKRWPQLSVNYFRSQQSKERPQATEDLLSVSLNKAVRRATVGLIYFRSSRRDDQMLRQLWEATGIEGDASLEIVKSRRVNLHYEDSNRLTTASSQLLRTRYLRLNTQWAILENRLTLVPVLEYRRQSDEHALRTRVAQLALCATMKIPRGFPGTDLRVDFNWRHAGALGMPDQRGAGLVLHWNLRRL